MLDGFCVLAFISDLLFNLQFFFNRSVLCHVLRLSCFVNLVLDSDAPFDLLSLSRHMMSPLISLFVLDQLLLFSLRLIFVSDFFFQGGIILQLLFSDSNHGQADALILLKTLIK